MLGNHRATRTYFKKRMLHTSLDTKIILIVRNFYFDTIQEYGLKVSVAFYIIY